MTVIAAETAGVDAGGALSPARLYLLRAGYLVLVVGLGLFMLPELVRHDPLARGVIPSLLGAVWLLALIGLRWPLQMIPLLLFELAWKTIWLLDYGLGQWSSGRMPATTLPPMRRASRSAEAGSGSRKGPICKAGAPSRPTRVASMKLIGGEPMKLATNIFTGLS